GERFTQPQVIEWARQLLEAVCYLHSRPPHGILHSDIKPANIMLTPQGDICLIDFNIALALGESGAVAVGRSQGYASPEHYGLDFSSGSTDYRPNFSAGDGGHADASGTEARLDPGATEPLSDPGATETMASSAAPPFAETPSGVRAQSSSGVSSRRKVVLDVRSDIYSLGATLYHLLTGQRPATTATEVNALSPGECSPRIVEIINRAMAPDANLRYQSAEEMLSAFNRLHESDPRAKRHRRRRLVAGVLLAAAFLASGLASFAGLGRMEQTQSAYASAERAANVLAAGDVAGATRLALEALPEKSGFFAPPRAPLAQSVLADALGVYDLSDGYRPFRTVKLPAPPFKIALSESGKTAAAVYAYEVAVFRTETGEIAARLPAARSALADIEFIGDELLVYAGESGICAYDAAAGKTLWTGKPATEIAVSADGGTIAAVYRDEDFAAVYDANGTKKAVLSFGGRKQRLAANDTFANPNDNLLALNADGSLLAASFDDGSLSVFNAASGTGLVDLPADAAFTHFEGGFSGPYFAFSATGKDNSVFAALDMRTVSQTGGFQSDGRFGVSADESGVFVSADNIVVLLNPADGAQQEVAYTEGDVIGFARDARHTIVATDDNAFAVFSREAGQLSKHSAGSACDFVRIAGDFAVVGGRDTPVLRIVRRADRSDAQIFVYDASYAHDEARVSADGTRVMLFSYDGFRLHDETGRLIREAEIPDAGLVYDQQYSKRSGNLTVLHRDALRIYSGTDGALLFEATDLRSAFYAPYGVSVLDRDGKLRLIDADTAEVLYEGEADGAFAAYCGRVVDEAFLAGEKLLGATKTEDGYLFAVGGAENGAVYDDAGKKRFDFITGGEGEAFFTADALILSPAHGTPAAYSLETGGKIADLEKDAYLTYVTETEKGVVSEYISADGERFGILLDAEYKPAARLAGICDVAGEELLFDYKKGNLRKTRIYSIDELIDMVE
ncbi:MAG: PQQ-binding-like beta-propeller repeat protein, partial [Clostridiales Family XIII bacterium]|nr:PQQ-binding-like beta-propeller repeat protein [Clostridiales Family XIII bacterium]